MKSVKCDKGGDVGAAHQRSPRERNFFSLSGHCLFKVRLSFSAAAQKRQRKGILARSQVNL